MASVVVPRLTPPEIPAEAEPPPPLTPKPSRPAWEEFAPAPLAWRRKSESLMDWTP